MEAARHWRQRWTKPYLREKADGFGRASGGKAGLGTTCLTLVSVGSSSVLVQLMAATSPLNRMSLSDKPPCHSLAHSLPEPFPVWSLRCPASWCSRAGLWPRPFG